METGSCIRKLKGHGSFVNSCYPARRGPELICSGSDDGTVKVCLNELMYCIFEPNCPFTY